MICDFSQVSLTQCKTQSFRFSMIVSVVREVVVNAIREPLIICILGLELKMERMVSRDFSKIRKVVLIGGGMC